MIAFTRLEVLRTLRSVPYLATSLGFPVAFFLLFTMVFDQESVGGNDFGTHMMVSMAFFGAFGAGLTGLGSRIAIERNGGWTSQLAVTPMTPGAYVASKVFSTLVVMVPIVVVVLALGAAFGARLPALTWLAVGAIILVAALPFAALGLAIGYLFGGDVAQGLSTTLYLILAMLGGLWIPLKVFPGVLQSVGEWLPTYRGAEAAWRIAAGDSPFTAGLLILTVWSIAFALLAGWSYRRTA